MRDLLTILACALVVVLTAALVGPYLVDWSAQRALVEARLSQTLGARVRVGGPISLTLLPTPSLSVGDLSIASAAPGGPSLTAAQADFELAATALMRGELQFMRADLEKPALRLSLQPDGAFVLPGAPPDLPQKIDFDQVRLRDATLIVARAGVGAAPWTLRHVDLRAQAASLAGPFSGSGSIGVGAAKRSFRFDAGARRANSIALQASLGATADSPATSFDGALLLAPAGAATKLVYQGAASAQGVARLAGVADLAWRLEGQVRMDAAGVALDKGDLRLGSDQSGIEAAASGKASFATGAPVAAAFVAQQIDMDRFLKGLGAKAGARLTDALRQAIFEDSLFKDAPRPLRLSVATPAMTLGGDTLTGTRLSLDLDRGAPARLVFASQGPGGAHLSWNGSLETGPAAVLRGRLDAGVVAAQRLADWLAPAFPDAAARLKAAPFRALAVSGDVDISEAGFDARDLVVTADRTILRGAAAYTERIGQQPARLYADLRSNALDLDALPDLSGAVSGARDMDLALDLDARAVRLAHFGQGMVDAGRIVVSLHRADGRTILDKLSLANVGGANLSATGTADAQGARLDGSLDADRLDELAAVVSRIAPGPFADALAARAVALSPAHLSLRVQAAREANGAYRPVSFSLRGSARDAQATGSLTPDPADAKQLDLAFDLNGPDSAILLRQLGFAPLPLADSGAGRVEIKAHGAANGDLAASVVASLADADLSFVGDVANWTTAPSAHGRATLTSGDAAPFLRLMTVVLPDPSLTLPASVAATIQASGAGLALTDIVGSVAGDRIAGAASLAPGSGQSGVRLSGALSLDRLSFGALAGLALGPSAPASAGALWSSAKFAPGLAAPPATDLALAIKAFDLAPGWTGTDASLHLKLGAGLVGLDGARMKIGAGTLSGRLDLRRDGPSASLSADLTTQNLTIDRPFFSGRLSGKASFAASGASALDLANGLAGNGGATLADLRVARAAPDALARLLAMSDDENFKIDAPSIESALEGDLDKGSLDLGSRAFDLAAAGGFMRLESPSEGPTNAPGVRASLGLSLDLRTLALSERVALTAPAPKDWPETAPPRFVVDWRAARPDADAQRTLTAEGLIGDLATRAAAREAARISALDSDIQERAFFQRRLKGLRFMHRREQEVDAWKAEQARAKAAAAAASASRAEDAPASSAPLPPNRFPPSPAPPARFSQDPLSLGRF